MKDDLLELYIDNVRKWSQATLSDSPEAVKATTRHGKKADQIVKDMKNIDRSSEILNFLQDADPGVKFSVASHALRFNIAPEVAMPTFQSLLSDPSTPLVIRMMIEDGIQLLGLNNKNAGDKSNPV